MRVLFYFKAEIERSFIDYGQGILNDQYFCFENKLLFQKNVFSIIFMF